MRDLVKLLTLTTTVLVTYVSPVASQESDAAERPAACSTSEHRGFDFWVGEWEGIWPREGGMKGRAINSIESILDGCVIMENFSSTGPEGNGLVGKSVSTYNRRLGKWQQTWVDNQGSYLDFTGDFKDGKMILALDRTLTLEGDQVPDSLSGKESRWRMVWFNIGRDSFDWNWERSLDGGKTWEVVWPLRWTRKK